MERGIVSVYAEATEMKEGKPLPFSVEDRAPTLTTLTAMSEAPRRRTRPSSRVATSTMSSASRTVEGKPLVI